MKNEEALSNVRRKVDEVMKKEGDKLIFGWRGEPEPTRKEGDVWEDASRKQWTIKNGIKQNITKLDKAKESINLPLFCPCCSNIMKKQNDKLFYLQYKRCFDCQVDFETELRIKGLWNDYEKHIINSDIDGIINDFNIWINEEINESNTSYVTEAGDVERWVGSSSPGLS